MYQLIVMSFDGVYHRENPEFETIQDAWDYSSDIGSKWYFYPFHFVVKNHTIKDAPDMLYFLKDKRIKTARKLFKTQSELEVNQNADVDSFIMSFYN